jgi:hypothetical protein
MKRLLVALLAAFVLLSLCIACDTDEEEDIDDLSLSEAIAEGKKKLAAGAGIDAQEYFRYARDLDDQSEGAAFGLILANTMALVDLVDDIVPLLDLFAGDPSQVDYEPGPDVSAAIQSLLDTSANRDFADAEAAYQLLAPQGTVEFGLSKYELTIAGLKLLSLGGEFDKTDVHIFGASTALINGVLQLVQAYQLDLNLGALAIPPLDLENDLLGSIVAVGDLLEVMLNDPYYDDFLVMEEGGEAAMQNVGIALGDTFNRLNKAFLVLENETDDQGNDQFRFNDADGNGTYDPDVDAVSFACLTLEPELAGIVSDLSHHLALAFWEGSSADPNPLVVDKLSLGALDPLLIYLGVFDGPTLPAWIGFNIGELFSDPHPAGLRGLLEMLVEIINAIGEAA